MPNRMPKKVHHLKIWQPFLNKVKLKIKGAEVRFHDRDYENGDILHLQGWNPAEKKYTGDHVYVDVLDVIPSDQAIGLEENYSLITIDDPRDTLEPSENIDQSILPRIETNYLKNIHDEVDRLVSNHPGLDQNVISTLKRVDKLSGLAERYIFAWQAYVQTGRQPITWAKFLEAQR